MDWYLSFFKEITSGVKAVGELSHDYLFSIVAAERIKKDLPDVKLLTILRNPVERSFSHYLYIRRSGLTKQSFEEALKSYPELINNSIYHPHLSEYYLRFSRSSIKVMYFDDLKADPRSFAEEIFDFLGLDHAYDIVYDKKVRTASSARFYTLAHLAKKSANFVRNLGLPNVVGAIKHSPLTGWLYKPYSSEDRPQIDPATRSKLDEIFRPHILSLQSMLSEDLSYWLE